MAKYLVLLSKDVYSGNTVAQEAIEEAGASVIKTIGTSHVFEIEATAEQLEAIAGVEHSESSDTVISAKAEVAYSTNHLKVLHDFQMSSEYNPRHNGTGMHVYLIDTGLSTSHQEFGAADVNNMYSNFSDDSSVTDFDDEAGHGTVVGALIVGANVGVVPNATLHNVKLFNSTSADITVGEIIDALDAVLAHHNTNEPSLTKVACMPWTIPQNAFVDAKIRELSANGIVVVAAAGNDGVDVNSKSPAGVDSIITVGAYDSNFTISSFTNLPSGDGESGTHVTNYGAELDIFTLAVDITTVDPDTTDDYVLLSGTSLAAGIVAGTTAQLIQRAPSASAADIKISLISEGKPVGQTILSTDDSITGVDYSEVTMSIAQSELHGTPSFAEVQSGRIAKVLNNSTVTVDLGLLDTAVNVQVLDFAPTPEWITFDADSGSVTISPDFSNSDLIPGHFLFAVKGEPSEGADVVVEEYSVGVYATDESELEESAVASYYYDADSSEYDAVVNYQVAPKF